MVTIRICSTATAKLKETVSIHNIFNCLPTPTCIQYLRIIAEFKCTFYKSTFLSTNEKFTFYTETILVKVIKIVCKRLCTCQEFVVYEEHCLAFIFKESVENVVCQIYTVVIKCVHLTIDEVGASQHYAVLVIVCLNTFNFNPTICSSNTIVIGHTIDVCTVEQFTAHSTGQLAVNHLKIVICYSRNGCTPVYNRITYFTEGSAGIAVGTGFSLVGKSHRRVNVRATMLRKVRVAAHGLEVGVHFRIHTEFFIGEGIQNIAEIAVYIGDLTHINVHLQVVRPEVVGCPYGCCIIAGNVHIRIKVDDPNRKLRENCLAGRIIRASTSDCNGRCVGFFVNSIRCIKAVCQNHVIQFPVVYTVQVDHSFNRLNGFDVGRNQIHPEHRTKVQSVLFNQGRIVGNNLNGRSLYTGFHLENADHGSLVACIVVNFKLYAMITVCNCNIGNGQITVHVFAIYLYTVNVGLGRSQIETGIVCQRVLGTGTVCSVCCISNRNSNVQHVIRSGDNAVLVHILLCTVDIHHDSFKDGSFTVVYYFRIVYSNVVDVVGEGTINRTIGRPKNIVDGFVENDNKEEFILITGCCTIRRISIKRIRIS